MQTNGQKFSQIWITLTELSDIFGKTPAEIGLCLEELGLRSFHAEQHQFLPTPRAHERELCLLGRAHRKKKGSLYLWHKQKVSTLLQEGINLMPLDEDERKDRALALQLLSYCQKKYHSSAGFDPLREVLFAPTMPTIIAWYVIETKKREKKEFFFKRSDELLSLLHSAYFHMINYELARLGSEIRLDSDAYGEGIHLGDVLEFADCEDCREFISMVRGIPG